MKELESKLSQEKATCEHLKSKLEKYEKDQLDQLKSIHQEKNLELSRVENEMRQQILELESMVSSLEDEKAKVTAENCLLNDTINKLRIEVKEKMVQISSLELSVKDVSHKLHDSNKQNCEMERNYKSQLTDKEQVVFELTKLKETLTEKLQAESSKLDKSERKVDELTIQLNDHRDKETQFNKNIAKLEADIKENIKKIEVLVKQLEDANERAALVDQTQLERITQYESDISLMKEANNKKIDFLSMHLKEYKEKSEAQTREIIQYKSDISLLKESSSKEFEEKEAVILEKQRTIEKLEEQKSTLGMKVL